MQMRKETKVNTYFVVFVEREYEQRKFEQQQ